MVKKRLLNDGYTVKGWALERIKNKQCPVCGKPKSEFEKGKHKYCSPECQNKFMEECCEWRDWPHIRLKIWRRDEGTCKVCNKKSGSSYFPDKGWVIDHIIPIASGGGEFDLNNLQTLCPNCNKRKTARDLHRINKNRKPEPHIPLHKQRCSDCQHNPCHSVRSLEKSGWDMDKIDSMAKICGNYWTKIKTNQSSLMLI